jgi:hypothetical protein
MAKIWRATWLYTLDGQSCGLGAHWQFDGDAGSDEPDAQSIANKLDTHASSAVKATIRDTGILTSLRVLEELDPASSAVPDSYEKPLNLAGTYFSGTAGDQPDELCAVIHRRTTAPVRGAKGWVFTPSPLGGASISNGLWSTGSVPWGLWSALADKFDEVLDYTGIVPNPSGKLNPVVYSRTRRRRGESPYTFKVTSAILDRKPRWLRSHGN